MESAAIPGSDRPHGIWYVPAAELERLRGLDAEPTRRAALFADACRINVLYMIMKAGSGHIGTSFSSLDIMSWLHLEVLEEGDRFYSSKGHDAPALYAVLIGMGLIDFDLLHLLRRREGLPGHPDVRRIPQVHTNTGSLGMGISKAKGFVQAGRLLGRPGRVFVMTGDGELQEGQFWESLQSAANHGLGEITAIVDHNQIQSDTWVSEVSDLGDLEAKIRAFGWAVERTDGNDAAALADGLARLARHTDVPKLLIADTTKGAGARVFEPDDLPRSGDALYPFHSGAPDHGDYEKALAEISGRLQEGLSALSQPMVALEPGDAAAGAPGGRTQRLIGAYGDAIVELAAEEERMVALDADLVLDTGLVAFRKRFPERFFECGIAEQDMVSRAGAMALSGLVPVVHSFGCFLAPRPNEQIYNNTSEGTKVVYVGSLVGLVPGGPGHSHQSVRDIAALGANPGMALLEPYTEEETRLALRWAVREAPGPVYIRLVSVPWELGFEPPAHAGLVPGRGTVLREGADALVVTTGPVMVSQAWRALEILEERGISGGLVALPWLRDIDGEWLSDVATGAPVFCLDNHYTVGGQGDAVLSALAATGRPIGPVHKLGVEHVPLGGTADEVLSGHGLDAAGIAERVATGVSVAR